MDQHVSNACRILLFGFVSYRVYYLGISKHKAPISLRQLTDVNEKLVCLKNFRFVAEIDLRHLGPFGIFDLLKYDKNVSRKLVVERTIYFVHVSNRDYAGMDVYSRRGYHADAFHPGRQYWRKRDRRTRMSFLFPRQVFDSAFKIAYYILVRKTSDRRKFEE